MRAQCASRFTLLLAALLFAGLAAGKASADDQSVAQKPLADAATATAPRAATPAPVGAAQSGKATAVPAATTATAPVAEPPAAPAEDPQTTGSLPEDKAQSAPPLPAPAAAAAVGPDQPSNPTSGAAAPATATPAAPTNASPTTATPPPPSGPGSPDTPAAGAAAPAVPTFADRLHKALDAYVASEIKGRDAAEIRKLRAAIAAFYAARNYAPLWVENGTPNAAARSAMARLAHADDDGLSLDGLPTPVFPQADENRDEKRDAKLDEKLGEKLLAAEIDLTAQVVGYGREASGSRVDPQRISRLIGAKPQVAEPAQILASVAAAGSNAGTALENFNPPQAAYRALRDKLAELRRETKPVVTRPIPSGPTLKLGMSDPRVPLIRARFGLDAEPAAQQDNLLYDTRVAAAVAEFQKAYGLPASGVLTGRTIAALTGGQPSRLENELVANMEFWRWMPRDMGSDRIEVNIPDFTVSVIRDNQLVWRSKVIVGKPQTPTPVFSNMMRYLIVNPYWNVPRSIMRKEMLPRLAQDPAYLDRLGFEVFIRHGRLVVRQPPGAKNALGRIKFMFPNDYSVYLHDTPSRSLFGATRRAFSHGCVRVDQPFSFAQAVLGPDSGWSERRVEHLIGDRQRYVFLPKPLPIHIEYFTAFVDPDGRLQLRDDIYGYAGKAEVALGLEK